MNCFWQRSVDRVPCRIQPAQLRAAEGRLERFLGTLTPLLGRVERQAHSGEYVRGLLLDGVRKSIAPLAERVPGSDVQALRQFVKQSPWDWAALTTGMLDRLLPEAVLIIDETSFPKKSDQSVGVARQYCGALGKTANCQVAVSVHLGTDTACLPLTWGLYLLQSWIDDPVRRATAAGSSCQRGPSASHCTAAIINATNATRATAGEWRV